MKFVMGKHLLQQPVLALLIFSCLQQDGQAFSSVASKDRRQRPDTLLHASFVSGAYLRGLSGSDKHFATRRRSTQAYLESLTRSPTEVKPRDSSATSLDCSAVMEPTTTTTTATPINDFWSSTVERDCASSTMEAYEAQVASFKATHMEMTDTDVVIAMAPSPPGPVLGNVESHIPANAAASMSNIPETKTDSVDSIVIESVDMWTRIAMATDYVMDNSWSLEDLKACGTSLTDLTKFLADFTESSQNTLQISHAELSTALQGCAKQSQTILQDSVKALVQAETRVLDSTTATLKLVTNEMSVGELSDRVAKGLLTLGELAVTVLNIVVQAVSGQTVAKVAKSAQDAAAETIAEAVATVVVMAEKFGELPVTQFMQTILNLVTTISRVLFRIFNTMVEMVTGKEVEDIGKLAAQSFEKETAKILEAANATTDDLSKKSLRELIVMLGKFEVETAETIMKTATKALESVDGLKAGRKGPQNQTFSTIG